MKKWILAGIALLLVAGNAMAEIKARTAHVVVALCDNQYQGIVKVPQALGNGQDPKHNLYWGAGYGIKTFFNKQKNWTLIEQRTDLASPVLERVVFQYGHQPVYLVADAYDGRFIKESMRDFFHYSAGLKSDVLKIKDTTIFAGGRADMVVFVGHNGLMDWHLSSVIDESGLLSAAAPLRELQVSRQAAVFACKSQQYFSSSLKKTGISPAMLTTQFMAPEAYVVEALIDGWRQNKSKQQIHQQVAQVYSQYQKLKNPARKLFTTEYQQ